MRQAMDLISVIGMAQSIQHCGHVDSECKLGFDKNAHAGSRTRVTSMGGLYDAATLHAPCQVYPFPCTLTGSSINDHEGMTMASCRCTCSEKANMGKQGFQNAPDS
jgi:hypothetical protein